MDSSKGPKRLLELESSASGRQEASQNEADREDVKRQHKALESTGDDFEEFVALLDRIQYMKSKHINFGISEEISMREDSDVKVNKPKSPCIPSFEWEDFGVSAAKKTMSAQTDICSLSAEDNPSGSEEKGKQIIQPGSYTKIGSSSDAYDKSPAERFDLNVDAS